MSPRPESWETVARALAARMEYQANICPVGRFDPASGEYVGEPDAFHLDVDAAAASGCAFCADTVAYRRFRAREAGVPYAPRRTM